MTGYGSWIVNLAIGLFVTPILLRQLGVDGFGAWTVVLTVASYVGLVELGLGLATTRYVAAALATGDIARASAVAASARATFWLLASVGTLVLAGLVMIPGLLVETGGVPSNQVRMSVFVLGMGFLLSMPAAIYILIAQGAGRQDLPTTVGVASRLCMAVAQVAVVLATDNLVALALVTAFFLVAGSLAARAVSRRAVPDVDIRLANASTTVARELVGSGLRNAAIGITSVFAIQSDVLVVGAILGPAAVAAYGIAVRASTMVSELAFRATDVLVPTFAHTTAQRDDDRTVMALRESAFLARAVLVPAFVILAAFGDQLLDVWLGEVPRHSSTVLILLVAGAIAAAPGHSCFVLLRGMNRLTFLLIGLSITAAGNLALSVFLTLRIGIVGPAVGSLAGFVAFNMLVLPRHVAQLLRIRWLPLSFAGAGALALPVAAASASAVVARTVLEWSTPVEGIAGAALVGLVYLAFLPAALGRERRGKYRRLLVSALRRRSNERLSTLLFEYLRRRLPQKRPGILGGWPTRPSLLI